MPGWVPEMLGENDTNASSILSMISNASTSQDYEICYNARET